MEVPVDEQIEQPVAETAEPSGSGGENAEDGGSEGNALITLDEKWAQIQLPQAWDQNKRDHFKREVMEPMFQKHPHELLVGHLDKATYGTRSSTHDVLTCFTQLGGRESCKVPGVEPHKRGSCPRHGEQKRAGYCVYLVKPTTRWVRSEPYPSAPLDGRARWVIEERIEEES